MAGFCSLAILALSAVTSGATRAGTSVEVDSHAQELARLRRRAAEAVVAGMSAEAMELVAAGVLTVRASWGRCDEICGSSQCNQGTECRCNCRDSDRDGQHKCPHSCGASRSPSWMFWRRPTENKGNTVIHFFIDAGEFDESYEAIPKKLRAGGLDMKTFDQKCLSFVTASGGALDGLPEPSDFPLAFTYTPCAPAAGAANTPKGEDPAEKPDEQWYDATQEDVDFAALAEHVYHMEGGYLPDGWTVSEHIELPSKWWQFYVKATDRVALYRKDSTCVLAFSGSDMNDIGDWLNNANGFFTMKYCGKSGYHRGFVDETDDVLDWEEFFRIMPQVEACASLGRLVLTGHSLGGAMATNFAECVNSNVPSSDKHPILRNFPQREVELWTFGAPGTRRGIAASNDRASDGVFKGRRFFSYSAPFCASRHCSPWCCWVQNSWRMQDPIPWLAYNMGFWHPKIVAVGLDSSGKKVEDWKATNEKAYREPDTMPLTINPFNKKQMMALTREHSLTETYKPRLEKIRSLP